MKNKAKELTLKNEQTKRKNAGREAKKTEQQLTEKTQSQGEQVDQKISKKRRAKSKF